MVLSKEQILSSNDFTYVEIEIPEWGGTLRLRGLDGIEREAFEKSILSAGAGEGGSKEMASILGNMRATLVSKCIVDAEGELLFGEDDVALLGRKNASILERVFKECAQLSGIAEKSTGAVADAVGKSEETPGGDST